MRSSGFTRLAYRADVADVWLAKRPPRRDWGCLGAAGIVTEQKAVVAESLAATQPQTTSLQLTGLLWCRVEPFKFLRGRWPVTEPPRCGGGEERLCRLHGTARWGRGGGWGYTVATVAVELRARRGAHVGG
jgi:hypothetical protein